MPSSVSIDLGAVAHDLGLPLTKVERTVDLLDEGNTVAFITRYRKDQTGGLDEEQIRQIQLQTNSLRMLAERKQTILKSIESQGKLTPALAEQILTARSTKRLEDIYLPYKPRKQTLAAIARQRGLEPFAQEILDGAPAAANLDARAADFVSPDRQLHSVAEVLHGVGHLLAERLSERAEVRARLRKILHRTGHLVSSKAEAGRGEAKGGATATGSGEGAEGPEAPAPDSTAGAVSSEVSPMAIEEGSVAVSSLSEAESPPAAVEAVDTTSPSAASAVEPSTAEPPVELSGVPIAVPASAAKPAKPPRVKVRLSAKDRKRQRMEAAFKDYYDYREAIARVPPHRILAINRGERAKVLRVRVEGDNEEMCAAAIEILVDEKHSQADFLRACTRDALNRLVLPSLEREIRRELTERAEAHAVSVFVRNLRNLLLQPPVRGRRVLSIDPGFRSGCKLVALDEFGNVLEKAALHVIGGDEKRRESRATLVEMMRRNRVGVVAIGNGTGCRDTEQLVAETLAEEMRDDDVAYVIVNEAGASVYSTSPVGREELPDYDAELRGAISIGRRLLDPLSELVKITPANIGVGLYQHDVKAKHLRDSLDDVVRSCVNFVGVEVNTASPALLSYVSGLNQLTARRLYDFRCQHGPFVNRDQFRDVPGIGEATFIQSAGFLKIAAGNNPLDATWIHPESYPTALRVLERLDSSVAELAGLIGAPPSAPPTPSAGAAGTADPNLPRPSLAERVAKVDVPALAAQLGVGELLLKDILASFAKPRRDPRDDLPPPVFRRGVMKLEDLKPGMELTGTVLNVVDFGAFVDIGISDSALVHISRLADHFVRDPHEVVSVGNTLRVWVLSVDRERRRVALTAIPPGPAKRDKETGPGERPTRSRPDRRRPEKSSDSASAPKRTSRPPAKPKPKPAKPITQAMVDGQEPMRSFSDLLQFYERKRGNKGPDSSGKK